MNHNIAKFSVGQLIHHKLFAYRGVIVDVDPMFNRSDAWYERAARTRPPKDEPWYAVLVHDRKMETYVAERNLIADQERDPVRHPLIHQVFEKFEGGVYHPRQRIH
jgi:heat shock protein HspQ